MKKILLLSDIHIGSKYAPWPEGMEEEDSRGMVNPIPVNAVNAAINAHWKKMIAQIRKSPPDVVIFNGDLIEGDQRKERGRGLMTGQIFTQYRACLEQIQTIRDAAPKAAFYFTAGTDYHQLPDGTNADQQIARHFNAEYGDEMVVEECGIRLFCRHTISSSMSTWQYMACYSDDTEVLTQEGWRSHKDAVALPIATYFPGEKELRFLHPKALYTYHHEGEMVQFSNKKGASILVTPNHKMWVSKKASVSGFSIKPAESLITENRIDTLSIAPFEQQTPKLSYFIPPQTTDDIVGHPPVHEKMGIPIDDWAEFLGYYLSEGGRQNDPSNSNHQVTFGQKNSEEIAKMESCFNKMGFHFSKRITDTITQWVFNRKQLWQILEEFGTYSYEKRIPRHIFNEFPTSALERLFHAMMLGDGSYDNRHGKNTPACYYTTSPQLAEGFQELATRIGYQARVTLHYKAGEGKPGLIHGRKINQTHDMYRIYLKCSTPIATLTKPKLTPYNGDVVCFETKTGLYLTRRPGCYPTIQGNTAPGRDHMLLYLNKGEEKYGKIDVAVFSHRHQFVCVQFSSGLALVTPCWQSKTPYAVKRGMVGVPEIGWVTLHIDHAKKIAVDTSGIATVVRPCKVVGRGK